MTGIHQILLRLCFFLLSYFIFSNQPITSQCTNGTQPECACETAPVLCSIDDLDGYSFSMTSFQHPNDGPTPICQGANSSQSNNPTWFAFTAWCTNLRLRVSSSDCHEVQNAIGFQLAIYTNCNFNQAVACNADIDDCNTNDKILNLTGLNIGAVYYFMVDGCLGSYCDVTIDIIGVCGQEEIDPWTQPVSGNMNPCTGAPETYTVEDLDGAGSYHWFIDGTLTAQTPTDSFTIFWTNPGTYQLCIDASNDPCVDISDLPPPLCTTITVHETDAGTLSVSPAILCPGDLAHISNAGYTTGIGNGQFIIITDVTGLILNVRPGGSFNAISDTAGIFIFYAYNYLIPGGTIPVAGGNISDLDCTTECCDLVSQTITYQSIESIVSDILCDDKGTGNDSTDDTFTFNVLVTGFPAGMSWRSTDGTLEGTYGTPKQCGPYLISGGQLNFDLHDYNIPTCFTSITVEPPKACSFCLQTIDAGQGSMLNCINIAATLTGSCSETGAYQWIGPNLFSSDSLICTVSDSGWYFLNIGFANQCTATDSVFVDLLHDAPDANAGSDQLIDCNHSEVLLDGSASTGDNLQIAWTNVNGNVISTQTLVLVNTAGTYYLQLINSVSGCSSLDSADVFINQNELGIVSMVVIDENCDGENNGMIEVTDVSEGMPPYTYSLNGLIDNSTGQFNSLAPGEYNLHITDADGCTLDTFFTIHQGIHLELTVPEIIRLTDEQTGFINATVNVPVENLSSIHWSPAGNLSCDTCLSTMIVTHVNQTLQLTIIHINGCVDTAELTIIVIPTARIYIPNTFSPNGDGFNDLFTLYSNNGVLSILELNIFDRWGEHIYQAKNINPNNPEFGWDGKFHGEDMPSTTFVYKIIVLQADGSERIITGDVTLIK